MLPALLALTLSAKQPARSQSGARADETAAIDALQRDPRAWLPADERLQFRIEATLGPVRGLDIGSVTLACVQAPAVAVRDAATTVDPQRPLATIDGLATGTYLGRKVEHSIAVRWYEGSQPRIECTERMRGSRVGNREVRVGESDGRWMLEHRKDRHCKGCKDRAHYVDGLMPWSKPAHCDGCDRRHHRVWREPKLLEVPSGAVDIVSALYFARGFLRSDASSTSIALVNQDELWTVHLKRGEQRKLETPAGKFDCVRVLIGPELAAGEGPGEQAAARFEALFGLHGDISVWVERSRGFPVVIEGTAPIGPFDVHVKASLTSHRGG